MFLSKNSHSLKLIDLSYNKINTFEGLDHPKLKCLNLNHNKLNNLDTMLMDTFSNLQVLELRNNQFISLKVSSVDIDVGDRFRHFRHQQKR